MDLREYGNEIGFYLHEALGGRAARWMFAKGVGSSSLRSERIRRSWLWDFGTFESGILTD